MTLEELDRWADDKGIKVIATGDFTHPKWLLEIKEKLEPAEAGLFKLKERYKLKTIKDTFAETRFFWLPKFQEFILKTIKGIECII